MSDHESNGMSRRDHSPIYRTPLRGTIVTSPMPQSGVFNTSSSLMRTPPADLRAGMNPFQKGKKAMPRKKSADQADAGANAPYKSKKDAMRDYDPTLYEEIYGEKVGKMSKAMPRPPRPPVPNPIPRMNPALNAPMMRRPSAGSNPGMMKAETCAQCGAKISKRGLCKCGTMGKVQKGWMDSAKGKVKDLATQGLRAVGRAVESVPTGRTYSQETADPGRSQRSSNGIIGLTPAGSNSRRFFEWAETQGRPGAVMGASISEAGNSATNRTSFINPQVGSKGSAARKMTKGASMCKCGSGMSKAECTCKMSKSFRPMPERRSPDGRIISPTPKVPGMPKVPGNGRIPVSKSFRPMPEIPGRGGRLPLPPGGKMPRQIPPSGGRIPVSKSARPMPEIPGVPPKRQPDGNFPMPRRPMPKVPGKGLPVGKSWLPMPRPPGGGRIPAPRPKPPKVPGQGLPVGKAQGVLPGEGDHMPNAPKVPGRGRVPFPRPIPPKVPGKGRIPNQRPLPVPIPPRKPDMTTMPVERSPQPRMGKGQGAYIDGAKAKVTKRSR